MSYGHVMPLALHLVVDDPDTAARWYRDALGATETSRLTLPDGLVLTVELRLDDTVLAIAAEMPARGIRTPAQLGGCTAVVHLDVADAEAALNRALEHGAVVTEPLHDAFWGKRTAQITDPSGHRWALDQHLRDVAPEELQRLAAGLLAPPAGS